MQNVSEFLTVTDAAERIGVTVGYLRRLLREGGATGIKVGPRCWLIDSEEAERLRDNPCTIGRPRGSKNRGE